MPAAISTRSAPTPRLAALNSAASITSALSSPRRQSISGQRTRLASSIDPAEGSMEGVSAIAPTASRQRPMAALLLTATPMPIPPLSFHRDFSACATTARDGCGPAGIDFMRFAAIPAGGRRQKPVLKSPLHVGFHVALSGAGCDHRGGDRAYARLGPVSYTHLT